MLSSLTATQLAEWEAYDYLDPVGEWREDFRMGQICTTIAKVVQEVLTGEVSKRTPADFIPRWGEDPGDGKKAEEDPAAKKQSVDEMKKILYAIAGHQKKVKKKETKNG